MQHNMGTWTSTMLLKNYEFKLQKTKIIFMFQLHILFWLQPVNVNNCHYR